MVTERGPSLALIAVTSLISAAVSSFYAPVRNGGLARHKGGGVERPAATPRMPWLTRCEECVS